MTLPRVAFFLLLAFVAIPSSLSSPPLALALGVLFGLVFAHPYAKISRDASKRLLQASVVGLGFGMNLMDVMHAGRSGFVYTLAGITFALTLGAFLGRVLGVERRAAYLISVGTAICGGSAIAAVGPVTGASDEEMSVSIGTVFLLNAVGLLIFPPLGHAFAMSESSFGLWAALAIHDTSSVVGAAAKYGPFALMVATTVKLARARWIVPLTLATAAVRKRARHASLEPSTGQAKPVWPWFILFFLGAAVLYTYVPAMGALSGWLSKAGRLGLTITLFLIGTGMSRASVAKVGARPLVFGVVLWVIVAVVSLSVIRAGWVAD